MSGQSADTEFVVGKLGKSKTAEFNNQFFYGVSASSVYTNSFAGVGPAGPAFNFCDSLSRDSGSHQNGKLRGAIYGCGQPE